MGHADPTAKFIPSFINSFDRSFLRSFIHLFMHSFIHSFFCSFTHFFGIRSSITSIIHSTNDQAFMIIQSGNQSIIQSANQLINQMFNQPINHSFIPSPQQSLVAYLRCDYACLSSLPCTIQERVIQQTVHLPPLLPPKTYASPQMTSLQQ